jgi:hypothetical protein
MSSRYNDVVSRHVDGGVKVVVNAPRLPAQQNCVGSAAIIKRGKSSNDVAWKKSGFYMNMLCLLLFS